MSDGSTCQHEGCAARRLREEIPFASARKWSALAMEDPAGRGVYVLGAPDLLCASLHPGAHLEPLVEAGTSQGFPMLLFAFSPELVPLRDEAGEPRLPSGLLPLGMISLRAELRPEARHTLQHFAELGIRLKIISGDQP